MSESFTLVPREVPGRRRYGRYADILREFRPSGEGSVLVEVEGKQAATIGQGPRKVVKDQAAKDVRVVQRGEETYLARTPGP